MPLLQLLSDIGIYIRICRVLFAVLYIHARHAHADAADNIVVYRVGKLCYIVDGDLKLAVVPDYRSNIACLYIVNFGNIDCTIFL